MVKVEIHKNERENKTGKFVQIINGLTSEKGIFLEITIIYTHLCRTVVNAWGKSVRMEMRIFRHFLNKKKTNICV